MGKVREMYLSILDKFNSLNDDEIFKLTFLLPTDIVVGGISLQLHDGVIKWKHFPHYWPFVRGIPLKKASDAEL